MVQPAARQRSAATSMRSVPLRMIPALAWLTARKFADAPLGRRLGPPIAALAAPVWAISLFMTRRRLYYGVGRAGRAVVAIQPAGRRRRDLVVGVLEFAGMILPVVTAVVIVRAVAQVRWGVDIGPTLLIGLGLTFLAYCATMFVPYPRRIWHPGPQVSADWTISLAATDFAAGLLMLRRQIEAMTRPGDLIEIAARDEHLIEIYGRLGFERLTPTTARMTRRA